MRAPSGPLSIGVAPFKSICLRWWTSVTRLGRRGAPWLAHAICFASREVHLMVFVLLECAHDKG